VTLVSRLFGVTLTPAAVRACSEYFPAGTVGPSVM
jgi:hypothetical protein